MAHKKTDRDREIDEMERWDRIDELREAVVATLRDIEGPEADIEDKWREVRLRRDGHLVCCIPTPLLEGVDADKIPEIVRSYLAAFNCGRSSMEPSVPFQIDREPVDPDLVALRQKKVDEIRASLDQVRRFELLNNS